MNNALTKTLTAGLMHGLRVKDTYENKVLYIDYTSQTYDFKHVGLKLCIERNERFKPILFPMSSLTKEIDFKGKRFVPLLKMWGERKGFDHKEATFKLYDGKAEISYKTNGRFSMIVNANINRPDQLYSWQVDFCRRHHINIDNLSPEEFIEVNEDNNPYKV